MTKKKQGLWLVGGIAAVTCIAGVVYSTDPNNLEKRPEFSRPLADHEVERLMKLIAGGSSDQISQNEGLHLVAHLRRTYPFESIRDRLPKLIPEEKRKPVKLSSQAQAELAGYETIDGRGARTYGDDLRPRSLELLHEEQVQDFIARDGNGRMRTPPPSAIYLSLTLEDPIPLDRGPVLMSIDREGEPIRIPASAPSLQEIMRSAGEEPFSYAKVPDVYRRWAAKHNPLMIPDQPFLAQVHRRAHDQFAHARGHGFIKSIDEVAGFVPHHLSHRPQVEPWDTRWYVSLNRGTADTERPDRMAGKDAVWLLTQMELVSLLVHDEPLAYVTDHLPRMDQVDAEQTRLLDEFESRALERLHAGDDFRLEGADQRDPYARINSRLKKLLGLP